MMRNRRGGSEAEQKSLRMWRDRGAEGAREYVGEEVQQKQEDLEGRRCRRSKEQKQ